MSKVKQALESAIEAFECEDYFEGSRFDDAVKLCKAALAELEKCEPVGIINQFPKVDRNLYKRADITWDRVNDGDLLYTSPQPREWVGLSDEQVGWLTIHDGLHDVEVPALASLIRAVEAKLKELNT